MMLHLPKTGHNELNKNKNNRKNISIFNKCLKLKYLNKNNSKYSLRKGKFFRIIVIRNKFKYSYFFIINILVTFLKLNLRKKTIVFGYFYYAMAIVYNTIKYFI